MYKDQITVKANNEPITVFKIDYDVNGNARYVVHFQSIGVELKDYGRISGLKKYRAKWFGGGYVFQSSNVQSDIDWMVNRVNEYYGRGSDIK